MHYSGRAWVGAEVCLTPELDILRMEETWVSRVIGNSLELPKTPTPQYYSCFQPPTYLMLVLYPGLQQDL